MWTEWASSSFRTDARLKQRGFVVVVEIVVDIAAAAETREDPSSSQKITGCKPYAKHIRVKSSLMDLMFPARWSTTSLCEERSSKSVLVTSARSRVVRLEEDWFVGFFLVLRLLLSGRRRRRCRRPLVVDLVSTVVCGSSARE